MGPHPLGGGPELPWTSTRASLTEVRTPEETGPRDPPVLPGTDREGRGPTVPETDPCTWGVSGATYTHRAVSWSSTVPVPPRHCRVSVPPRHCQGTGTFTGRSTVDSRHRRPTSEGFVAGPRTVSNTFRTLGVASARVPSRRNLSGPGNQGNKLFIVVCKPGLNLRTGRVTPPSVREADDDTPL